MFQFLRSEDKPISSKKNRLTLLLLSFAVPCLVLILGLLALHITPFGEKTIIISDAKVSYLPGVSFISRLLKGNEGILYSFKNGLGGNNLSSLAWGMINPLFALSLLGDLESLPVIYTWIVVLNLAISGVFMFIMLCEIFGWKYSNLIFSTSYALIGFSVVNDFQIIFFNGVHVLPLMVLGLYRIFRGKSPVVYIISLAYCIFANFFFGYVLCAASLVLFIAYLVGNYPKLYGRKKKLILTYGISSLFSGFIPAFILLPTIKSLTGGGRMDQSGILEFSFSENMPFLQMFSKLFTGANSTQEIKTGLPNIFCGILITALVILFFMNQKIEKRHRIAAGCVLVFYLLTFYIIAFSLVMQGFSHTNWFPYRYSFVFSFFMILIAAEEYQYLKDITLRDTKKCGIILLISVLIVFNQKYEFIKGGAVLLDLALLFLMWSGFYMHKKDPVKSPERMLAAFLLLPVSANLYANFVISTQNMMDYSMDLNEYNKDILVADSITDAVTEADPSFYRMENEYSRGGLVNHDSQLYDYQSVSSYSPIQRTFIGDSLNRLGLTFYSYGNFYSAGIPAALDSLLGIRYVIAQRDLSAEKVYEKTVTVEDTSLYKNPYSLSVSLLGTDALDAVEFGDSAFQNLNAVWGSLIGSNSPIFYPEDNVTFKATNTFDNLVATSEELQSQNVSSSSSASDSNSEEETSENSVYVEYSFTAQRDGPVYMFYKAGLKTGYGNLFSSMEYIGTYQKGDTVTGKFTHFTGSYFTADLFNLCCRDMIFAYADNNLLAEYASILQNRPITLNKDSERILSGNFTATDTENRLFFTIPWDEGWTCYIDGEKADIAKSCGCFMSVAVPAGTHTYEMRFFPAWMKAGIVISIVSLAACVVYLILFNKYTKKEEPVTENEPSSDDTPETERTGALPETVPEIPAKEAAT